MDRRSILCLVALLGLCCSREATPPKTQTFDLQEDYVSALGQAQVSKKLVLLYFYSTHCDYCDKMVTSFMDDSVQTTLKDYVVVGVDVDSSDLAKMIEVFAVPTLVGVVPNEEGGEPVSSFQGFLDPKQLKSFIEMTRLRGTAWTRANNLSGRNTAEK